MDLPSRCRVHNYQKTLQARQTIYLVTPSTFHIQTVWKLDIKRFLNCKQPEEQKVIKPGPSPYVFSANNIHEQSQPGSQQRHQATLEAEW